METKGNQNSSEIEILKTDEKIANSGIDLTPEQVAIIKNTVAKGTTNTELAFFLNVCKTTDLNPFIKEIWCYKDKMGNLITFASRDGFLKKAQMNKAYAGIRSSEVCENDDFLLNIPEGKINHIIDFKSARGKIIGGYAMVFRKGGEPTIEWADINTYDKKQNAWSTHKSEMIKKVAEVHALKKAFGISALQSEHDFEIRNERAFPISNNKIDLSDDSPIEVSEIQEENQAPKEANSQDLSDDKPVDKKAPKSGELI